MGSIEILISNSSMTVSQFSLAVNNSESIHFEQTLWTIEKDSEYSLC